MEKTLSNNIYEDKEKYFNYSYGRYFSNGVLVLTTLVMLIGIVFLFLNLEESYFLAFIGLIMIILGFSSYLPVELLQINNHTKEYRVAIKLGSYIKGDWIKLGEIQYLSIVNKGKYINLSGTEEGKIYKGDIIQECQLRLFKRAGYTIPIDYYKHKESALIIGKIVAQGLDLPLLDATEKPPVFIDL